MKTTVKTNVNAVSNVNVVNAVNAEASTPKAVYDTLKFCSPDVITAILGNMPEAFRVKVVGCFVKEWRKLKAAEDAAKAARENLKSFGGTFVDIYGDNGIFVGKDYKLLHKAQQQGGIDSTALKHDMPAVYEAYKRKNTIVPFKVI